MVCYLWFSNTLGAPKNSPHYRESTAALKSSSTGPSKRTLRSNSSSTTASSGSGSSTGTTTTEATSVSTPSSTYSLAEPLAGLSDATTAALQFAPSPQFINFMQKLLQTTQVSQSVIVLSLHYIYRLKEENHFTNGKPGSEFRVAVVALMLANKFIDDNTYTNKTWSEVSGIELQEINKMEREFLRGVAFRLYVNTDTYKAWVNLLEGLVAVKERDQRQWHYSRRYNTSSFHAPVPRLSTSSPSAAYATQPRARSSSPLPSLKASYPFTFVAPSFTNPFSGSEGAVRSRARPPITPPSLPGVKRPAIVAFSPPSATLQGGPTKRPISLNMSLVRPTQGPVSAGSAYPLSAFAQLSLNKPNNSVAVSSSSSRLTPSKSKQQSTAESAQTLAAPYTLQDRGPGPNPQHLYYYTLASSPTHCEGDNRVHKALLRSHLPPTYQPVAYLRPPAPVHPTYTQSASASPVHPSLPSCRYLPSYHHHHPTHPLPPPPTATTPYAHSVIQPQQQQHSAHPSYVNSNHHSHNHTHSHTNSHNHSYNHNHQAHQHHLHPLHQSGMDSLSLPPIRIREPSGSTTPNDDDSFSSSSYGVQPACQPPSLRRSDSRGSGAGAGNVPVAPFANAGPPGVHHWPSASAQAQAQYTQQSSLSGSHHHHHYPHSQHHHHAYPHTRYSMGQI